MFTIKQWLHQKSNWATLSTAILLGLSVPGIGIWPLAWIGLIPALWAVQQAASPWQAWRQGLLWGSLYHGFLFSWFWGLHPLTWMGFPSGISLGITLAGWGVAAVTQGMVVSLLWVLVYFVLRKSPKLAYLAIPLLWTGGFWFLNQNPIGLPWGFLAYSQASVPFIRHLSFPLGFWGLEMLIILMNVSLFYGLQFRKPVYGLPVGGCLALMAVLSVTYSHPVSDILTQLHPVIIQGNIPIEADRLLFTETDKIRYYQSLINQIPPALQSQTRLILLPEGVITLWEGDRQSPYKLPAQAALLSGGIYQQGADEYNGALLFANNQLSQTLGKRYLVPFGETTPFIPGVWLQALLKPMGIDYSEGFSRAPDNQPPIHLGPVGIGPLICFEALYPNLGSAYKKQGVRLLVTFSNLGWYHQNPLLEQQFLAINQLRASESGLPVLLVTNTGVSAIISPQGDILARSDSGKTQLLTLTGEWNVGFKPASPSSTNPLQPMPTPNP